MKLLLLILLCSIITQTCDINSLERRRKSYIPSICTSNHLRTSDWYISHITHNKNIYSIQPAKCPVILKLLILLHDHTSNLHGKIDISLIASACILLLSTMTIAERSTWFAGALCADSRVRCLCPCCCLCCWWSQLVSLPTATCLNVFSLPTMWRGRLHILHELAE